MIVRPARGLVFGAVLVALCMTAAAVPARAEPDGGTPPAAASNAEEDAIFGGGPAPADAGVSPADAGAAPSSVPSEQDLFGGGPTATPKAASPAPAPTPSAGQSADALALVPLDEKAIAHEADVQNDKLTIGGLMYLRLQTDHLAATGAGQTELTSPNLADLYLDARPNDDLRLYIRGRLVYNPSINGSAGNQLTPFGTIGQAACSGELCPYLDQFWMKWNIAHKVFFTLGRQHIKWGTGRFWNPTDFLNPLKLNPLDIIDQRLGVDMLKIHVPVESRSFNFYGLVTLDGVSSLKQIGYAGRAEFTAGPTEFTFSAAYTDGMPLKLGTDLSFGVGDFDGHIEGAVLHPVGNGQIVHYEGSFDTSSLPPVLPTEKDLSHQWLPQIVAGGEYSIKYSDQDALVIGAEYFYNSIGYDNANLYPVLIFTNNFTPLYNGKHYGAAYLSLPNPGDWNNTTFQLTWIGNLSDNSHTLRFDYRVTVLTFLQVSAYAATFLGNGELHYGLEIPPNPNIAAAEPLIPAQYQSAASALAHGVDVRQDMWELGLGLILNM
jgi:hypothetical protein